MIHIKKLSLDTINLISAGEVIESPADVLKELLENSIDAGSTDINVEVKGAGVDLILIKDNGSGISKEDLPLSIERHATSKLLSINDLFSLESYGFRGEALASINAVSKLSIISSIDTSGKGYLLENGVIKEVSANKGTAIIVKDLFYNLPVRKKFLKSKSFEFSSLYNVFLAYVLSNPNIRFTFVSEKRNVVFPESTQENRFIQVFGKDVLSKTLPVNISNDLFNVQGIISNPKNLFYYPTNFLYINKRFVYSPQIYKAIASAYKDYLMVQQKPFFVLSFILDKHTVDVNVHPKKKEVKLQNGLLVLMEFKKELTKLFNESNFGSQNNASYIKPLDNFSILEKAPFFIKDGLANKSNMAYNSYSTNFSAQTYFTDQTVDKQLVLNGHIITKIFGQIDNTYILCETKDGFLIIDQHAADERINLEKNRKVFETNFEKQNLVVKKPLVNLSDYQKEIITKYMSIFNKLGFDFSFVEDNIYLISIPSFLNNYFDTTFFLDLLASFEEGDVDTIDVAKDRIIKLMSCKQSVKANHPLFYPEIVALINNLESCKDKTICAHGRPTMVFVSISDLEKMFKRVV